MPELAPSAIKNTDEPLNQFLKGDNDARISICSYYDSEINKLDRRPRIQNMLSNADSKELEALSAFVAECNNEDSDFLSCLKRGIEIKQLLLELPTSENPLARLSTVTKIERFHEFHNFFSKPLLDGNDDKTNDVAEKIVSGYETLEEATQAVRALQTIQHALITPSPFLVALNNGLRKRINKEAPAQSRHMFARQPAPSTEVEKAKETATANP